MEKSCFEGVLYNKFKKNIDINILNTLGFVEFDQGLSRTGCFQVLFASMASRSRSGVFKSRYSVLCSSHGVWVAWATELGALRRRSCVLYFFHFGASSFLFGLGAVSVMRRVLSLFLPWITLMSMFSLSVKLGSFFALSKRAFFWSMTS